MMTQYNERVEYQRNKIVSKRYFFKSFLDWIRKKKENKDKTNNQRSKLPS